MNSGMLELLQIYFTDEVLMSADEGRASVPAVKLTMPVFAEAGAGYVNPALAFAKELPDAFDLPEEAEWAVAEIYDGKIIPQLHGSTRINYD